MRDPLDPVRAYLEAGHSLRALAAASGVPHKTIHNWMQRGTPLALTQGLLVLAAVEDKPKRRRPPAKDAP